MGSRNAVFGFGNGRGKPMGGVESVVKRSSVEQFGKIE